MTELIIVSRPRMRFIKWIGGGVYKQFLARVDQSYSESAPPATEYSSADVVITLYSGATIMAAQQFVARPSTRPLQLRRVDVMLNRVGSPTGTVFIRLYSDSSNNVGSLIATVGSISASSVATTFTIYTFTPSSAISLTPGTKYWVVIEFNAGNSSNYIQTTRATADVDTSVRSATYTTSWSYNVNELYLRVEYAFGSFTDSRSFTIDFQYMGPAEKRLKDVGTKENMTVNSVTVNGVSVGNTLEETDQIPQATQYTITYNYTVAAGTTYFTLRCFIERRLYYAATSITLDQLGSSEAYIVAIYFSGGGHLRIDDNPDADFITSGAATIRFDPGTLPFRKLEWLQGSGEVDILAVE
ncbi:MAG: choice-of-anchor R domain-containing protein [Nitrososphaerota archaeon]|nr:hypothetical protein [Candidatus Calditenuaceae archaeon]MDW8073964.1 choice-of-anchor R domain-containing protein [Nitrososphaerota archaeon]